MVKQCCIKGGTLSKAGSLWEKQLNHAARLETRKTHNNEHWSLDLTESLIIAMLLAKLHKQEHNQCEYMLRTSMFYTL